VLKIDRSFVARMTEGEDSSKLVASIIEMAQSISLRVVAEGVETSTQESFLRQMHCEEAQGFLFSKGIPATEIGALITDWHSDCIA
jgi:EAL domain-containing protein (putative c-di-GMP-specific phosphodiesterase class I)